MRPMLPLQDFEEEAPPTERAPVPDDRASGVRLRVSHVAPMAATVDVVVCDLSRDPRSEDYRGDSVLRGLTRAPAVEVVRALRMDGFRLTKARYRRAR
jgi:hypothetical protein